MAYSRRTVKSRKIPIFPNRGSRRLQRGKPRFKLGGENWVLTYPKNIGIFGPKVFRVSKNCPEFLSSFSRDFMKIEKGEELLSYFYITKSKKMQNSVFTTNYFVEL